MQTMRQFVQKHRVRATVQWAEPDRERYQEWPHNAYRVTLMRSRGAGQGSTRMTVPFMMGLGLTEEPSAEDVLNSLALDASGEVNTRDLADWASDYGYGLDDPEEQRKTRKLYRQVQDQTAKLRRFLETDELFEELVYQTDGL